jgi:hypothetical protein
MGGRSADCVPRGESRRSADSRRCSRPAAGCRGRTWPISRRLSEGVRNPVGDQHSAGASFETTRCAISAPGGRECAIWAARAAALSLNRTSEFDAVRWPLTAIAALYSPDGRRRCRRSARLAATSDAIETRHEVEAVPSGYLWNGRAEHGPRTRFRADRDAALIPSPSSSRRYA